jgi:ABC-type transport system substrate-binding protein
MKRLLFSPLSILVFIQIALGIPSTPSLAQEWKFRKPRGTLNVVQLVEPCADVNLNYAEALVGLDKDNELIPLLAEDWRWIDDQTIEFRLRKGVTFHNGEKFNAEAVRINWEAYRSLENPSLWKTFNLPDETELDVISEHTVRFKFPVPDGLAFVKLMVFDLFAPAFFASNSFAEFGWG